jgi:hypothetical protein
MKSKPYVFSGIILMAGYMWAAATRTPMLVSTEFVRFRRKEQMRWLREFFVAGRGRLLGGA